MGITAIARCESSYCTLCRCWPSNPSHCMLLPHALIRCSHVQPHMLAHMLAHWTVACLYDVPSRGSTVTWEGVLSHLHSPICQSQRWISHNPNPNPNTYFNQAESQAESQAGAHIDLDQIKLHFSLTEEQKTAFRQNLRADVRMLTDAGEGWGQAKDLNCDARMLAVATEGSFHFPAPTHPMGPSCDPNPGSKPCAGRSITTS